MNPKPIVLATAVLVALSALTPAAAALDAAEAGNVAVSTDPATDVTNTSATLNGNLTSLGGADNASVAFEYWEQGDEANATAVSAGLLESAGTFSAGVSGLENETTYVYVAAAEADDGRTATGGEVTFTTGAAGDDGGAEDAFGQEVSAFVHEMQIKLKSGDIDMTLGQAVSTFVLANNPGNPPDHAGPPADKGAKQKAEKGGPPADKGAKKKAEKGGGPPDHAKKGNQGDDGTDDGEDEDEGDADDDDDDDGSKGGNGKAKGKKK